MKKKKKCVFVEECEEGANLTIKRAYSVVYVAYGELQIKWED